MERIDCLVVGAGVVGLAIARALAEAGREVIVVDAADGIGTGTSSRNSEVIHAGIYYPPGSLKAELCVRGRQLLYPYCEAHGVEHRRCGKLIVATRDEDRPKLDAIAARARASGVLDLEPLTRAEALAMEPALDCVSALWSPSTGIVDSHGYMTALLGDAERAGAMLALLTPLLEARRRRRCLADRHRRRRSARARSGLDRQCRRAACPVDRAPHAAAFRRRPCRRCISPRATTSRCAAARRSRA